MTTNFTLAPPLPLSGGPLHPSTPYPSPTLGFKLDPIVSPPIQKTKAAWQGFTSISLPPPFSRYSLLHPESSYPLEDVRESRVSNGTLSVVSRHSKNPGGSRSALLSDDGPKDGVQVNPRKGLRLGSQKNFSSKPSSSSFSSPTSPTSLSTTKMTAGTLTNHQKPAQDPCRFVGDSKAIPWIPHLPIDVLRVRDADDALEDFLPQIVKDGNVNCISFAVNKKFNPTMRNELRLFVMNFRNQLCRHEDESLGCPTRVEGRQGDWEERLGQGFALTLNNFKGFISSTTEDCMRRVTYPDAERFVKGCQGERVVLHHISIHIKEFGGWALRCSLYSSREEGELFKREVLGFLWEMLGGCLEERVELGSCSKRSSAWGLERFDEIDDWLAVGSASEESC